MPFCRVYPALFALTVAVSGSSSASVNLVMNGDFSQSSYTSSTEFGASFTAGFPPSGQGVTNWSSPGLNAFNIYWFAGSGASNPTTVTPLTRFGLDPGNKLALSFPGPSPDGGNFISMDGDFGPPSFNGPVQQLISNLLIPFQTYEVSFYWAGTQLQNRTGTTTEQLEVSLGSANQFTSIVTTPSQGFMGWRHEDFIFTNGSSTSALLSFLAIGTPGGLPPQVLLDGVSVTQVPEPGSAALIAIGLLGLGVLHQRRRAPRSAAG
jgi:hypothetical protein